MRRLEQDSRDLQTKMAKLQVEHASAVAKGVGHAVDNSTHKLLIAEAESEYRSKRELAWQDQVYILQNATQRESYRTVIERYVLLLLFIVLIVILFEIVILYYIIILILSQQTYSFLAIYGSVSATDRIVFSLHFNYQRTSMKNSPWKWHRWG